MIVTSQERWFTLKTDVVRNGELARKRFWGIRAKVFALVILAALLPTFLVGSSSYWTARRTLGEKLSDQLNTKASLAAARISEWLQERQHDAMVFASSSIVLANLETPTGGRRLGESPLIRAYLEEVRGRYGVYSLLLVLNSRREPIAFAGSLPDEGLSRLTKHGPTERSFVDWNDRGEATLWLQSPILGAQGKTAGFLVLACDFEPLRAELAQSSASERLRLTASGRIVLAQPADLAPIDSAPELVPNEGSLTEYRDARGTRVLAAARAVTELDGSPMVLVVATDWNVAFAAVTELGRSIVLLSALVAVVVIGLAYGLVVSLTDPLEKLTLGAHALSRGDYSTELPVRTRDEIGDLTHVFNQMTSALKRSHEGLERLSATDELTKLGNRRQFRKALDEELVRAEKTGVGFAIVLIDLDHFKRYNDRLGHVQGDALLEKLGAYLLQTLESPALAARYGGEEFVLILPKTGIEEAAAKAEWIRAGFFEVHGEKEEVTLSLGVAAWPRDGRSALEIIDAADRALYEAKNGGRNRVATADGRAPMATKGRQGRAEPRQRTSRR
ncbi:MAG TPA: diguanylate cyclase [Vicinamibacteria bacterium]